MLCGILAACWLTAAEPGKEPTYKGKTLSAWMAALRDGNGRWNSRAIYALGDVGPEAKAAVPALTEALKDKGARFSASPWETSAPMRDRPRRPSSK
jgi:hypothetical protein